MPSLLPPMYAVPPSHHVHPLRAMLLHKPISLPPPRNLDLGNAQFILLIRSLTMHRMTVIPKQLKLRWLPQQKLTYHPAKQSIQGFNLAVCPWVVGTCSLMHRLDFL